MYVYIYMGVCHRILAIEKKEILPFAATLTDLEDIIHHSGPSPPLSQA